MPWNVHRPRTPDADTPSPTGWADVYTRSYVPGPGDGGGMVAPAVSEATSTVEPNSLMSPACRATAWRSSHHGPSSSTPRKATFITGRSVAARPAMLVTACTRHCVPEGRGIVPRIVFVPTSPSPNEAMASQPELVTPRPGHVPPPVRGSAPG